MIPHLIAEIGGTHIGKMSRAKELIKLAHLAGADAVKLQKRNPIESVPKEWHDKPHPNQLFAYGETYLEHRLNLELDISQHAELKAYCEDIGILYSTSVWDMTSTKEVIELNPTFIKVPSACNHRFDILDCLVNDYKGQIHISLGMTTVEERKILLEYVKAANKGSFKFVTYHCTSAYPCPFDRLYLREITKMQDEGWGTIGFSNHGAGIATDIAALAYGARYFERHFIDDRTFPHTDSSASLEPQGLSKLCRDLKHVYEALSLKPAIMDNLEQEQRDKLRNP